MPGQWTGVVLTGGTSRRMGVDKALLEVDGEAMARRVAEQLAAAGASAVLCVGGDLERLRGLGLTAIADGQPGAGPLAGLLSALVVVDVGDLLVTPCDLLEPRAGAFATIVGALQSTPALAVVPIVGGVRQPLNAAYRLAARAALQAAFDRGERSVKRALLAIDVLEVEGIDPSALADADTPEDLHGRR